MFRTKTTTTITTTTILMGFDTIEINLVKFSDAQFDSYAVLFRIIDLSFPQHPVTDLYHGSMI